MKAINRFMVLCTAAVLLATNAYAQEKMKEIDLACEMSLLTAPVWVAENKGYFQKEGVSVKLTKFDSGKAAFVAMLNKNDFDICTVAQVPIVFQSFKRNDFTIIGAMFSSDNMTKVLVRTDKGIKDPSDLKGKKTGVTKGTTGQFVLDLFLTYHGILSSEIEVMDLKPSELPQALADGRVDTIVTWEPHISKAKEVLGEKAVIMPTNGIYRADFYFVARKDFVKNNPDTLERFLKAIEKGEEFIQEKREESINIISQRLKIDKKLITLRWGDYSFKLILDQTMLISLEDIARWAIKEGLTGKNEVPNYLNFIYINTLEAIKPIAVTIIR